MYNHIETIILIVFLVFGSMFCVFYENAECKSKAKKQGFECSWGVLQGCQIKVDGRWVEYSKYRVTD